ncbi:MAG TPA: RsmD family RNA methyltransferase, partial [Phycisphaerales bacterium]|nr:RsmD family RNA methyltransferase [Phycisphaerales bacterium]
GRSRRHYYNPAMRIIAGAFRRRVLKTPPDGSVTRPIPDRVKESLFQLLRGHYEGATVFDAFAGTGAIGLEAVSRGAVKCVLVEKDRRIAEILRSNVEMLQCEDRCEVLVADALGPAAIARAPRPLHLAFLDPPYPLVRDRSGYERVKAQMEKLVTLLDDTGFIVLRTPWPLRFEVETEVASEGEMEITEKVFKKKANERVEWKREQQRREREEARAAKADKRDAGKPGAKAGTPKPVDEDEFGDDIDEMEMDELEDTDHNDDFKRGDREESAYMSPEEMNELLAAEAADAAAIEAASGKEWEDADLSLPGADGPETHVYHGMAVHLYCRKKKA